MNVLRDTSSPQKTVVESAINVLTGFERIDFGADKCHVHADFLTL